MTRRLLGTGTTDSNGRVSINYTGVGAGKLQIVAVSGTLESNTYELIDAITYDKGTSTQYKDMWTGTDYTLTRYADYSEITESTSGTSALMRNTGDYNVSNTGTIEFDFMQVDGPTNYSPIYIRTKTGGANVGNVNLNTLGESIETWFHVRIVFDGSSTAKIYTPNSPDGVSISLSTTYDSYGLAFSTPSSGMTTLRFKEFVVY